MLFIGKEDYTMKKITLTALFFLVIFLTACGGQKGLEENNQAGNEVAGDVTDAMTNEAADATQANTESDTQKPNIEALPNEEGDNSFLTCAEGEQVVDYCFNEVTQVKTIVPTKVNERYFIGRDNFEENIGYFNKYLTEDTEKLYIKKKMYLPDYVDANTVYCKVSDESIAKVDGNTLVGLRQGSFTLTCYDKDMNVISEKSFIVSTYNDSLENIATAKSFVTTSNLQYNAAAEELKDAEYCKEAVSTIMDMSYLLQVKRFVYDGTKEPDFGALDYNVSDEERWNWTASAKTIFDMNAGVCIQVAQLATYMLADDFEDWGVVMIEGNQGHIFNWFFEDGKYYVFDFTEVISDNCGRGYEFEERFGYRDYSRKVQVFDNIEDFKNWCITSKVDVTQNYAVYMYSCQGHDFIAANINSGMSSSFDAMNGGFDELLLCYQDVVMEDLVVFYLSEISNAKFVSVPTEEVPWEIPIGVYNRGEKTWYFEYE